MAIKQSDGSILKLAGPNPLMNNQQIWETKYVLHNRPGTVVTIPDPELQKIERKKEDEVKDPDPVDEISNEDIVQIWCLPASYENYTDPLYEEGYRKLVYGKKFLFEATIENQDDFSIFIWTNTKAVTEGSVLFPRSYDKRWWRVDSIKPDRDGYVILGAISDYQPDFSS